MDHPADYEEVRISEKDSSELADMKLAYITAARERDWLLTALKDLRAWANSIPGPKSPPELGADRAIDAAEAQS